MTLDRFLLFIWFLAAAPALAASGAGMQDIGGHVVHYNAVPAETLAPELAEQHGLSRTPGAAIVTIAVIERTSGRAVTAAIRAQASASSGRMHRLSLRELQAEGAILYVGAVPLGDDRPAELEFTLHIQPERTNMPHGVRFSRIFANE